MAKIEEEIQKELMPNLRHVSSLIKVKLENGQFADALQLSFVAKNLSHAILDARHLDAHIDEDGEGEGWKG